MPEAIFFVVERTPGGEMPSLCYDVLPARLTRAAPKGSTETPMLIYALRLDLLPDAARWLETPLDDLYAQYKVLRDAGKLPPSNLHVAKAKADPAVRKLGEYWEPPAPTWDQGQSFVRPAVGAPRPEAGAFIKCEELSAPD